MSRMNPNQPPEDGLPPQEIRIIELRTEPWPDNSHRVRIHLQITPFLERPNIQVTLLGSGGKKESSIDIIETIDERMTFTMHLKGEQAAGTFTAEASLYYPDHGVVDKKAITFELTEPST